MSEAVSMPVEVQPITPPGAESRVGLQTADRTKSQEVLNVLQPREYQDQEGAVRKVYTFTAANGAKVEAVFYSPNELPFAASPLQNKDGFILGSQPAWREKPDWDGFVGQVKDASKTHTSPTQPPDSAPAMEARAKGEAFLFVESTPKNILDLAFVLGMKDPDLRQARQQIEKDEYSPRVQAIMDRTIAGKVIDDNGEFDSGDNTSGEALTILALLGNKSAQDLLEQKNQVLNQKDQIRSEKMMVEMKSAAQGEKALKPNEEALRLKDLVAVHTTRYRPVSDQEGHMNIPTSFDATKGKFPRNTIHFSLNHPVETNWRGGNWENVPYVVVAPVEPLMKLNGNPASLNTVDTFFEQNPGEKLKLPPEARLIEPGEVAEGRLFEDKNGRTIYKAKDLSPADVKLAFENITDGDKKPFAHDVIGKIVQTLEYGDGGALDYEGARKLEALGYVWQNDGLAVVKALETQPVDQIAQSIFQKAGISAEPIYIETAKQVIKAALIQAVKEKVVRQVISQMSYENKQSGGWAWGGNARKVDRQNLALGIELGIPTHAHNSDSSKLMTDEAVNLYDRLVDKDLASFRARRQVFKQEYLPEMSAKSRKMMYISGLI